MKRSAGRAASVLALALSFLVMGCGTFFIYPGSSSGSGTGSTASDYVYVANQTTGSVAGFAVGTGTLTAVSGSPYTLGFTPTAIAVNPADSIVFVAGTISGTGYVLTYAIGSGGGLSLLTNNNVAFADMVSMVVSPDGQWLLGLDGNGLTIDEYLINSSTGALSQPATVTYNTLVSSYTIVPRGIAIAPNGAYVFVALGTAGDLIYPFTTSSGAFGSTPAQLLPLTGSSDNALTVSPSSSYFFLARSGTNAGLTTYALQSGGAWTSVSSSTFTTGTQPYSVALNIGGTDIYVADRAGNRILGYTVSSTGTLAALSSYTSGSNVSALAADKSGSYMLAASNGGSPDLWMYSFDSSGNLVSSTSTATGTDPTGPIALAVTH